MSIMNEFIRDVMFERKLTIKQVSEITNYSEDRIRDIVLKDISPTIKEIGIILDGLGIDFKKLLG